MARPEDSQSNYQKAAPTSGAMSLESFSYNDDIVKNFTFATVIWGFVALLLGVTIALQLASWKFNFGLSFLSYGRLRPLHTNAAIFAFAGNTIFAGIYYSTQRLCKARIFSDFLSKIHFWGWQFIIVCAALTIPFGFSSGKEYAELEWPIDILITLIWVVFAVNFFGTLIKRREKHIYVALWFYIATIVTVAVLHIMNSLALPVSFLHSYSIYSGIQDALIQWWYGHNAVAFFLTTPFLGLMYYFIPKAVGRPVYSYKLSIIHFWSLVFMYIWAGPHHLLYSSLPDWAQTIGMVFSVALIAPSWGGMINGLLTLRGSWDKVRQDPILKFLATAVTFYGMSTFEGPLMSIKSVNSLAHYTDWVIGHVHGGTLGWNGFLSFGMIYYLVPKLWKTKLYSVAMANFHFWLATVGIVFYMMAMWTSGITQGLMWRAVDPTGHLVYPDFVETVTRIVPLYWVRAFGGFLYLSSYCVFIWNIFKTISSAPKNLSVDVFQAAPLVAEGKSAGAIARQGFHHALEGLPMVFTVLTVIAIAVGSLIELIPTLAVSGMVPQISEVKPYTGLELAGRDIYVREGCYVCHSQMIRPLISETLRYGAPSQAEESQWDHPFQWGSKRTGPDLARVGGKYPNLWHYRHMYDPRDVTPHSNMPTYPWLFSNKIDFEGLNKRLLVMKNLGVPYTDKEIENAPKDANNQAHEISSDLEKNGVSTSPAENEIVALIAYLQRLGKNNLKAIAPGTL